MFTFGTREWTAFSLTPLLGGSNIFFPDFNIVLADYNLKKRLYFSIRFPIFLINFFFFTRKVGNIHLQYFSWRHKRDVCCYIRSNHSPFFPARKDDFMAPSNILVDRNATLACIFMTSSPESPTSSIKTYIYIYIYIYIRPPASPFVDYSLCLCLRHFFV